ncbi:MAG: DUF2835 family protein [Candidatus Scalindua sp. AMX11]|nr:MAG: DUF2835 family protein [Candidatus Scalindua sp.]NOG83261.1 DUF2835 domain-containing protein [Planctomycetota bacterium]RZV71977.1 MAG: DUF2835 family protein [Candidatus Scalindua sp. SCAELEC01]TDE63371.1 MAG: DUF2835 family protein [Candidatus Scalindua sp. AMX11]GJQ60031.1 MAG: hypothetical protein SCALA701_28320 [Candidatus Scalindua sp.]
MSTAHKRFQFSLHITPEDYVTYYEGVTTSVLVRTYCGKKVKFPASVLRQYVTQNGIRGIFEMEVDQNSKLVSVHKVNENFA